MDTLRGEEAAPGGVDVSRAALADGDADDAAPSTLSARRALGAAAAGLLLRVVANRAKNDAAMLQYKSRFNSISLAYVM